MINKSLSPLRCAERLNDLVGNHPHLRESLSVRGTPVHGRKHTIHVIGFDSKSILASADQVVSRASLICRNDGQTRTTGLVQDDCPAVMSRRKGEDIRNGELVRQLRLWDMAPELDSRFQGLRHCCLQRRAFLSFSE